MLIVKLTILDRSFALKRWLLLQHLLRVLVGQFAPKQWGQLASRWCGLIHLNLQAWACFKSDVRIGSMASRLN